MGFLGKNLSFGALKEAVNDAASKVSDAVQNVEVVGTFASVKVTVSATAARVTETVKSVDVAGSLAGARESLIEVHGRTAAVTQAAYEVSKEKAALTYEAVSGEVGKFDYAQLKNVEFYQDQFTHYRDLGNENISEYFHSTFEVEKSTMEMVEDIRSQLPVPAETIDDIFEQCKDEAIRRAVASFGLAGIMQGVDQHSEAKYNNLSEKYVHFERRSPGLNIHENRAAMDTIRAKARKRDGMLATVEDGYNKAATLLASDSDIEHVISKKEYFDDILIRIGTTDDQLVEAISSMENLIFARSSFNRSLGEKNILKHISKPIRENGDTIWVRVESTGEEVALSKKDVLEAYGRADAKRNEHRFDAAIEVGATVLKTGAAMAAQQVVGLIIVETIDIFVDEIRNFAAKGQIISFDGWIKNTKDATDCLQKGLQERFEERQIWTRAKELGIEAGVAGALSVIPQILISFIVRMPAFVLAMIRESTLGVVRCVRIMASKEEKKLESIGIILAATASTIVGFYVTHVISKAIMAIPLLRTFDRQVSEVLSGLLVTALPLTAIYAFDQNKQKLQFIAKRFASFGSSTA